MLLCVHTPLLMAEGIGIWQHRPYPAVEIIRRVDPNATCSNRLPRFLPRSGRVMMNLVVLETEFSYLWREFNCRRNGSTLFFAGTE
jgi:hypothetical protein